MRLEWLFQNSGKALVGHVFHAYECYSVQISSAAVGSLEPAVSIAAQSLDSSHGCHPVAIPLPIH